MTASFTAGAEDRVVQVESATNKVRFIETDDATCVANDGKLVSLALLDLTESVDVWVDRWFMQVQTADHTKHHLSADTALAELGCSRTNAGEQHWTIHSVNTSSTH